MEHFSYNGPVLNNFNQVITTKWEGETYANTDRKAKSNLGYQFKKEHGLLQSAKIILPNKMISTQE